MNNVYFVYCNDEENVGRYVAANNKGLAIKMFEDNNCLDCVWGNKIVNARLAKDYYPNGEYNENGAVFVTDYEGILNVKQLNEIGIVWFNCMDCGDDSFNFNENLTKYICENCGYEGVVPYAD